ncbi:uncharacterized protein J3R85_005098 [Psidium guajava]|nr:uncharacterized protein J3R85_005098 [Psidium guajava]
MSLEEKRSCVKLPLAETLAKFYPLAGRVRNNAYVDRDDMDASYMVA